MNTVLSGIGPDIVLPKNTAYSYRSQGTGGTSVAI